MSTWHQSWQYNTQKRRFKIQQTGSSIIPGEVQAPPQNFYTQANPHPQSNLQLASFILLVPSCIFTIIITLKLIYFNKLCYTFTSWALKMSLYTKYFIHRNVKVWGPGWPSQDGQSWLQGWNFTIPHLLMMNSCNKQSQMCFIPFSHWCQHWFPPGHAGYAVLSQWLLDWVLHSLPV